MKRMYDIIWLSEVDSTNNEALRRIKESDGMSVVSAICQTAGRGQRGNVWKSAQGENLTFSIAAKFGGKVLPSFPAIKQFRISQAVALSLIDFLRTRGIEARIKWPNDIYVKNRKICGILIENTLLGRNLSTTVIGIGLNVNQTIFPEDLPNPTSMRTENGREIQDLKALLNEFIAVFDRRFTQVLDECTADHEAALTRTADPESKISQEYESCLYGNADFFPYRDTRSGAQFSARISHVTPTGLLVLETPSGERYEYDFKEVELLTAQI